MFSAVCANVTVGTVTTHPRVLRGTEDSGKGDRLQGCVCVRTVRHLLITGKSRYITVPASLEQCRRKVEGNRKNGRVESASAGLGVGSNAGIVEVTVRWNRKDESRRHCKSASKEDITATLRHHQSLLKSMDAGAPAAARDAIASRIEILKQAIYAKEPFHVPLVKVQEALTRAEEVAEVKVQEALTRAEEVAEKKHSAVWTAREAADKLDQHVLSGRAHGEDLHGDGHRHERRTVELWRMARCWWLLVWLAVGSAG